MLNFFYMLTAYAKLDNDAKEVCIMILCIFLCEDSIYSRYLSMSFKHKIFGPLLKNFEETEKVDKIEKLEDVVKTTMNNK